MCWCNPDPGRRSWMTFSTRSRVSPVAGGCRRAASRRPRRSGAATTPYSSASLYLRWHPLVNYQPKWRIGDFFCECSNLEMIVRQMFMPNSMYWYFYSSVSNFHRRTLHGNRPKIRASDAQTNCGVLVCWSQILYDAC